MNDTRCRRARLGHVAVGGALLAASLSVAAAAGHAADETVTVVAYAGAPVPIPDMSTATADIEVAGVGIVTDLDVRFDGTTCTKDDQAFGLVHPALYDLSIRLTSPSGTTVTLLAVRGELGAGMCQTTFTDEAAEVFGQEPSPGPGPYPGSWRPAEPLSQFDGQDPTGTWRLSISDEEPGLTGELHAFSLVFTEAGAPPEPRQPFVYSFDEGPLPIPNGAAVSDRYVPIFVDVPGFISWAAIRFDGSDCTDDPTSTTVGLTAPQVADLTITLRSPVGTAVTLIDGPGVPGANLCQLEFTEFADTFLGAPPTTDQGPYTGSYKPVQRLTAFTDQPAAGEWTLDVIDGAGDGTASPTVIRAFTLIFEIDDTVVSVPYSGPAMEVPDATVQALTIPLDVGDVGTLADVDLRIDGIDCDRGLYATGNGINLWRLTQLGLTLTSPSGTSVRLVKPYGPADYAANPDQMGRHLCVTTFTDDATRSIDQPDGWGLFAGFWRPIEPLAAFAGESAAGTWILSVADQYSDSDSLGGTVTGFSLLLTTTSGVPPTTVAPTTMPPTTTAPTTVAPTTMPPTTTAPTTTAPTIAPPTTAPAVATTAHAAGGPRLPATGGRLGGMAYSSMLVIAGGAVIVGATRRRRTGT